MALIEVLLHLSLAESQQQDRGSVRRKWERILINVTSNTHVNPANSRQNGCCGKAPLENIKQDRERRRRTGRSAGLKFARWGGILCNSCSLSKIKLHTATPQPSHAHIPTHPYTPNPTPSHPHPYQPVFTPQASRASAAAAAALCCAEMM